MSTVMGWLINHSVPRGKIAEQQETLLNIRSQNRARMDEREVEGSTQSSLLPSFQFSDLVPLTEEMTEFHCKELCNT